MNQRWTKVKNLKIGAQIAVYDNGALAWDEVVSVKSVGREKVYDIEVENSHNFVGNGILAHNTYIFGNVGIGTTTPTHQLEVAGDIGATGFVNLSTREAKKDIEYLTSADYEQVLAKISGARVATYWYNDDMTYGTNRTYETYGSDDLTGGKRLGLIAEEAPREVLSADGQGVDLYKLASFTLMGVKALSGEVISVKSEVRSLEAKIEVLEEFANTYSSSGVEKFSTSSNNMFNQALETLSGETIELAPSSIAALVNNLYSSVLRGFRSLGLIVEQGLVRVQKLVADVLQINKLVVNTASQTDNLGETKDATIGSSQINVGELDTYIMNNQVSTTTKIFVTAEMPVALGACEAHAQPEFVISDITNSLVERPRGFRVCMNATSSQIVKFNWWIVETIADSGIGQISQIGQIGPISPIESPSPLASPAVLEEPASPSPSPSVSVSPSPSASPSVSPSPSVYPSPSPPETPSPSVSPLASPAALEEPASPSPSETPIAE